MPSDNVCLRSTQPTKQYKVISTSIKGRYKAAYSKIIHSSSAGIYNVDCIGCVLSHIRRIWIAIFHSLYIVFFVTEIRCKDQYQSIGYTVEEFHLIENCNAIHNKPDLNLRPHKSYSETQTPKPYIWFPWLANTRHCELLSHTISGDTAVIGSSITGCQANQVSWPTNHILWLGPRWDFHLENSFINDECKGLIFIPEPYTYNICIYVVCMLYSCICSCIIYNIYI